LSMLSLILAVWPRGIITIVSFEKCDIFKKEDFAKSLEEYYDEISRCVAFTDSVTKEKTFNYKVSVSLFFLSIIFLTLLVF